MKIEVDTTNLDLKRKIIAEQVLQMVRQEAIIRCPMDTGNLVASIDGKMVEVPTGNGIEYDVEISTDASDERGRKYASYIEFGTGPIENANDYVFPPRKAAYEELMVFLDSNAPLTSWEALRKRKEAGANWTGQTMPFMRTAVFFTEPEVIGLFKQAFR